MRIFNEKNIEIESPDLEKGYLKNDSLLIMHHDEIKAVEEIGHYETIAEYPNGGKDVAWVVDTPGVEAKEAWDEYEDILRYIPYTEIELKIREIERNRRPLSAAEVLEMLIPQQINNLTVDNKTALRMKSFYPEWETDRDYAVGFKIIRDDRLWVARQAHTSAIGWEPENVPALWEQINETNEGTVDDPIPYNGNMTLIKGLFYYQDGKLYLCNRDTGTAVFHPLTELVGIYVEIIE